MRTRFPGDEARVARMSLIGEEPERRVRMAHLATVGSRAVNGVAEIQSRLLRERTLGDFGELWPERFQNKTNGVTPRRFVRLANPGLSELISSRIGSSWLRDLEDRYRGLLAWALTYATYRGVYAFLFAVAWIPGGWITLGISAGVLFGVMASGLAIRRHLREV